MKTIIAIILLLFAVNVIIVAKNHHDAKVEREREMAEKMMGEQVRQHKLAFPR